MSNGKEINFKLPDFWKEVLNFAWKRFPFLVGGSVRDILLGRELRDLDLLVPDLKGEEAFKLADSLKSSCFKLGKEKFVYRIVTSSGKIDLKPFSFQQDLVEEARRRDFTINSLLLPLTSVRRGKIRGKEVIDFLGGIKDLRKKVLRLCQESSFQEDPVRLLRALRFSLELGFEMDKKTVHRLRRDKNLLLKVSAERIKNELVSLFSLNLPDKAGEKLSLFSFLKEIVGYAGLKPFPGKFELRFKKALKLTGEIKEFFPSYFEQEVEKKIKIQTFFPFFLPFFLLRKTKKESPWL